MEMLLQKTGLTCILLLCTVRSLSLATPSNCSSAVFHITNNFEYYSNEQRLELRRQNVSEAAANCFATTYSEVEDVLELVAVSDMDNFIAANCCRSLCKGSEVQDQAYVKHILSEDKFAFLYVEGNYIFRHRKCTCSKGYCFRCKTLECTDLHEYGESEVFRRGEACDASDSSFIFHQSGYSGRNFSVKSCNIEVTAVFGACSSIQNYTQVDVDIYEASGNDSCPDDVSNWDKVNSFKEAVSVCNRSFCSAIANNYSENAIGVIELEFEAATNSSFCVKLRQASPYCQTSPHHCQVHYAKALRCRWNQAQAMLFLPLSEPIFIGCVCGVLLLSLSLLLWTVVRCKKDQQHSLQSSPEPDMIKEKNIPRSLTIDEMEHIIRLRHQELVLVYFPDTERFMNLNRLFKNWLMSLSVLNVNDVTDIYETKYSEAPDGTLKNPEGWVSNLLSDPERRVVLVTSKLAFECLIHIRKGLELPKFPNYEAHSTVLTTLLKFLDSEMFRGNYRRLICVRYEDLKICDRRFGSESFNIVPGTEYLLPQHLEDVARWVHPIEAKPGLWAEHRLEVRTLLDSLKEYRHHEDNIFTVSFYDGENGSLLRQDMKSGY